MTELKNCLGLIVEILTARISVLAPGRPGGWLMPISPTSVDEKECWSESTWTVDDENAPAELIARVAIGQARVVEHVLQATDALPPEYPQGGFAGARDLLAVQNGKDSYYRDGRVFQVIVWIGAHRQDENARIRAPRMIKADKGSDGDVGAEAADQFHAVQSEPHGNLLVSLVDDDGFA